MKPCALLDVNALLALVWQHHSDHARMVRWHRAWLPRRWAVCPFTESGFLRISLNPAFNPAPVKVPLLLETLHHFSKMKGFVRIAATPNPAAPTLSSLWDKVRGHQHVTDAFLLAIAIAEDINLATFDRGIAALADKPGRVIEIS